VIGLFRAYCIDITGYRFLGQKCIEIREDESLVGQMKNAGRTESAVYIMYESYF
jgi:hypothetical protein